MPSWGFWNSESRYAIVQGEVDITNNLTAYAQAGIGTSNTRYLYSDIRVTSSERRVQRTVAAQQPEA